MSIISIFVCVDSISFKLKNNLLKLDSQRPTIMSNRRKLNKDSNGLIRFEIAPLHEEGNLILVRPLFCKSHNTMVNNIKVDSTKPNYLIQSKQLS